MVDLVSSGMIDTIAIYSPPDNNTAIFRYAQLALAPQQLEEDEVHNLEEKENIIMMDGKLATMVQQQEEDEAQKLMEK